MFALIWGDRLTQLTNTSNNNTGQAVKRKIDNLEKNSTSCFPLMIEFHSRLTADIPFGNDTRLVVLFIFLLYIIARTPVTPHHYLHSTTRPSHHHQQPDHHHIIISIYYVLLHDFNTSLSADVLYLPSYRFALDHQTNTHFHRHANTSIASDVLLLLTTLTTTTTATTTHWWPLTFNHHHLPCINVNEPFNHYLGLSLSDLTTILLLLRGNNHCIWINFMLFFPCFAGNLLAI